MKLIYRTSLSLGIVFTLVTSAAATFPDVPSLHPDAAAIEYLQQHLIFQGKPGAGTVKKFDPDTAMNRAELVATLIRTLKIDVPADAHSCFSDVQANTWFFKPVCTAERMGFVSGYPDGTFKPTQVVTKAEALKIISNALGLSNDIEMYAQSSSSKEWYAPYVTLAREWNLLDSDRSNKKLEAPMSRSDIAQLLYRSIITSMHRTATGDLPAFNETLAAQYAKQEIKLIGTEDANTFTKLVANGKEYRNVRLGFSLLLPKTMPTYMCDYQKPAAIVDVHAIENGDNVYIGPAWYESNDYLGSNPDGSGRYGECKRHTMQPKNTEDYTRIIKTRVVKNDSEIQAFIKENFGKECGPFTRKPSMQNGIEDIAIQNVPLPGVTNASGLHDFACAANYVYVFKYNPATKRVLAMNLGQDGFIYLPAADGTFGQALDLTIMRTLRLF